MWSAQLSSPPVSLAVSAFAGVSGMIVALSDSGQVSLRCTHTYMYIYIYVYVSAFAGVSGMIVALTDSGQVKFGYT